MVQERIKVRKFRALPVVLVAAVLCLLAGLLFGAQAPPQSGEQAESGVAAGGAEAPPAGDSLLFRNDENQVELRLPAPYWEIKTAEQIAAEAPAGGCVPARGAPPGMLALISNKDAQALIYVERWPQTFLMRSKDDLENYVARWKEMFQARGGAQVEVGESSYEERDGMIAHRLEFTAPVPAGGGMGGCTPRPSPPEEGAKVHYLIADFFVRPAGEEARLYRISCFAREDEFERQRADFESLIDSFRFTGTVAEEFFDPTAPPEKLPSVKRDGGASACGGPGLIVAVVVVLIVYFWFRSRSKPRGLLEP